MTPPVIIALLSAFVFAAISVYLALEKEKESRLRKNAESNLKIREKYINYHDELIKSLQEKIGFSVDTGGVIDLMTAHFDQLVPYSAISSLIQKDNKFIFKANVRESVGNAFIETVKDRMTQSLSQTTHIQNPEIQQSITGVALDDLASFPLASTIDIPFVLNGRTIGLINVSSTTTNLYTLEHAEILQKNADMVSGLLSKFVNVITGEKNKTRSLIDSFTDGLFMTDDKNNLVEINKAAKSLLHIQKENPEFSDILSSLPHTYKFAEKIQMSMNQNQIKVEEDVAVSDRLFKIVITPILDAETTNKVIGISVLLHDSTLEKTLSQMKEDFTNIIVHELRSPLTAIKASAKLLTSDAQLSLEEKDKLTFLISESTRKMLEKISLILDSAKLDAGLFTIKKSLSELPKLINDRVLVFQSAASEKGVILKAEIDNSLPSFSFDPNRIDEVVNNLLSNSLKFTPTGGSITVKALKTDHKVTVSVTDTGAGIPKDKQHQLFSKFAQVQSDSSSKGTGLGLYVVKGIVEAHTGSVNLESEVGRGTTISFTLPLEQAEPEKTHSVAPNSPEDQARMVN